MAISTVPDKTQIRTQEPGFREEAEEVSTQIRKPSHEVCSTLSEGTKSGMTSTD